MPRTDPQLNLRLPADLKEMLEEAAAKNKRSVTSETVDRLITSFSANTNPAHVAFLMSRMEMRAAEAEVDSMMLKMRVMELVWSLRLAIHGFHELPDEEKLKADIAYWEKAIAEAEVQVGEVALDVDVLSKAYKAKVEELTAATLKAKRHFDELKRQATPGE